MSYTYTHKTYLGGEPLDERTRRYLEADQRWQAQLAAGDPAAQLHSMLAGEVQGVIDQARARDARHAEDAAFAALRGSLGLGSDRSVDGRGAPGSAGGARGASTAPPATIALAGQPVDGDPTGSVLGRYLNRGR